jgi:sugar phosphate isomerase/epimerase
MQDPCLSRRQLIAGLAAGLSAGRAGQPAPNAAAKALPICAFSKHYQWTDVKETAEICARQGFDGVDLTVRRGGHVLPERVQDDLPKAAEIIRRVGIEIPMITSDIVDVNSPHAEAVIKTASSLGIRHYRWGGFRYDLAKSIPDQLTEFKKKVRDLAALNGEHGVCAMYHTHSGVGQVGASMWDLWLLIKDFSPDAVSANLDIGHATVEGGYGGWIHTTRLLLPYMRGAAFKDFKWKQNARGAWVPGWCALGEGMVNFKRYLPMLKEGGFSGPLQLHMEYDELGGADSGKRQISISKEKLLAIMQRDLDRFKAMLKEATLV